MLPMCWKCQSAKGKQFRAVWDPREFEGCEENGEIITYLDAKKLCPLLKKEEE